MKATFLIENLSGNLVFLNHAISSRNQLPILSNFLIEAKKGKITVSATDLEIAFVSTFSASVEEEGVVTIPAKTFSDFLLNIGEGKATFNLKGNNLEVKSQKIEAVFQTVPADDFPKIIDEQGEQIAALSRSVLEKEFQKVVFSASQDGGRPALSGVLIKKEKDGFSLVATDGYRLSLKTNASISKGKMDIEDVLVPARVIRELLTIKDDSENIEIFISKKTNQILFHLSETILIGRLIEGTYPPFEKIIPTQSAVKAEFDRKQMQNAVKICSVFARDTANIIRFKIEKNKIIVSANTPSVGENSAEVEAVVSGGENEIAFNARYLLDFLSNIEEEDLTFEMTGPLSPGVFKIKGDSTFLHLIMPIRVQE